MCWTMAELADVVGGLKARFPGGIVAEDLAARDPWIQVAPEIWTDVALALRDTADWRFDTLSDLTAVDWLQTDPKLAAKFPIRPRIELVAHLASLEHRHRLVVKIELPRWKGDVPGEIPEVGSVVSVWPIADWHERECYDLLGIRFVGHPHLTRILCPEDWVGHPLRKDYQMPAEYDGIRVS